MVKIDGGRKIQRGEEGTTERDGMDSSSVLVLQKRTPQYPAMWAHYHGDNLQSMHY